MSSLTCMLSYCLSSVIVFPSCVILLTVVIFCCLFYLIQLNIFRAKHPGPFYFLCQWEMSAFTEWNPEVNNETYFTLFFIPYFLQF